MAKNVATPKQTGGGGYTFEDQVSACFLMKMLAGDYPLDADAGQIECIGFQKRVDGWLLDDLVLRLVDSDAGQSFLAISVKSNTQITDSGYPSDYTEAIWEQRLHIGTTKFEVETDFLALATAMLNPAVKNGWDSLLSKSLQADLTDFATRIASPNYSNNIERRIFASLHCPAAIDSTKVPADTAHLLRRLRQFQFDFASNPSEDESRCISRCAEMLRTGGQQQAASLWIHLKQIARDLATSGGELSRTDLGTRLRANFDLKEFPNYRADWLRVFQNTEIRLDCVRCRLGGKLELPRDDSDLACPRNLTALVGASGSGKTVLAKQIASVAAANDHVVWLTSDDLNTGSLLALFSYLGLRFSFVELVSESIVQRGIIVIDGFEKLNQSGLANLAVLLRRAKVGSESAAWTFIFTCVIDAWEQTRQALQREYGSGLVVAPKTVEFRFDQHRQSIINAFPAMTRMLQRPHLAPVFGNLKMLDLVLSNACADTETDSWIGETDILEWYWTQHILAGNDGIARSRFVQKLAGLEADQFLTALPVSDFDSDECRLAPGLVASTVLWTRDEKFGFEHDLLGDWARTRYLLSRQHEVVSLMATNAMNPRWHRAIRLYGLRLIENKTHGTHQWNELVLQLSPDGKHVLESDLVLESVVFAANAESRLMDVWPRLEENGGVLLTRLLTRFLHIATFPDPLFAGVSEDTATAALLRLPFWPIWLPMLQVLHRNREAAIKLCCDQVTSIADLWLKTSGDNWPLRNEAAQILIDAVHFVANSIRSNGWRVDSKLSEKIFSRFFSASSLRPDEVAELALTLVERTKESVLTEKTHDCEEADAKEGVGIAKTLVPRGPLSEPWPDGPLRRVNHNVHDGFLASSNPLQRLFAVRPEVAKEVLLALLIREPLPGYHDSSSRLMDEFLHVETERKWTPSIFFHGPFLSFLRTNREKGIETLVSLVNFVTDRWLDNRNTPPPPIRVAVDGKVTELFGSSEAYYWYRDSVRSPNVVVPALMALERWLYLCLEQNEPIRPFVQQILRTSRSTALLGVLSAVGRKAPRLFKDELWELVPVWQLQVWEENYRLSQVESLLSMTMISWIRWGESIWNMVRDWHTLDHRKTTIGDVLFQLFLTDADARSKFSDTQKGWAGELQQTADAEVRNYLEKIAMRFDEKNWTVRVVENGLELDFHEPEERTKRLALDREANQKHIEVLTFPMTCRKLIDERKKLDVPELESFWTRLRQIGEDAEQARNRGDVPEHAILGGIAVLSILHEDWLEADSDRDKWCVEQFLHVIQNPPPHPEFHFEDSITNYHWDNFSAMLLPQILTENPTHKGIRSICADFALAYNFSVIQDLMSFAFEHRVKLGDDFLRLQTLILESSGMRNVKTITHGGNSIWNCPDIEYDLNKRFELLIQQFTNSETSKELPSLVNIAEQSTGSIIEMVCQQHKISYAEPQTEDVRNSITNRIKRGRGFEPMHLQAAFSWLANIEAATDSNQRAQWVAMIENLLLGVLRTLGGIDEAKLDDDDDNTFFQIPGEWDTWIFDLVAVVIPKLDCSKLSRTLWEPVLALGLDRAHWVDSFISAWFIKGLRVERGEVNWFREWKSMIAYVWTRENWRQTDVRNHHSENELIHHLMGFSNFGHGYLEDQKYRCQILGMKPELEMWTQEFFPHPNATGAFARFLTFPSSVDHLRDGVRSLASVAPQFQDWHWSDFYHLDHSLLELLEYDWKYNSRTIVSNAEIRKQFATILKTMSDRQIPRALHLQDEMARFSDT